MIETIKYTFELKLFLGQDSLLSLDLDYFLSLEPEMMNSNNPSYRRMEQTFFKAKALH